MIKKYVYITLFCMICSFGTAGASGEIKVGIYDFSPLVYTDDQDRPRGIYADILYDMARKHDWDLKFVKGTWEQCLDRLEQNRIDLLTAIIRTPKREERFSFSTEAVLSSWGQLYVAKGIQIENMRDLQGKTVAGQKGDHYFQKLRELLDSFNVTCDFRQVENSVEIFRLLQENRADAGAVERLNGLKNETEYDVSRSPVIFEPKELVFATPKDRNPALLDTIDSYLVQSRENKGSAYHKSLNKWLDRETTASLPGWVLWIFGILCIFLTVLFLFNQLLRLQVNRKTKELSEKKDALLQENTERRKSEEALRENEENLRTTLNSIGDAVISTDLRGGVIRMNPVAEQLTGWEEQSASGLPLSDIFHIVNARTGDLAENPVDTVFEKGETVGLANHTMLISRDGCRYQIADSASPIRDDNGNLTGVVLVFRDVTRSYEMEDALRQSEEKFRLAFETSPDSINLNRLEDGVYVDINQGFTHIMGYTPEEVIGKSSLELNIWNHETDRAKLVRGLKETGYVENLDAEFKAKNGEMKNGLMSASLIQVNGEHLILSITRDITERKQAENALEKSKSLLEATLEATDDGILVVDDTGMWSQYNQKFIDMWGIPEHLENFGDDKKVLEHVLDRVAEPDSFIERVQQLYENKAASSFDRLRLKDGTILERYSHPQVLEGRIVGRVWSFRDVTSRIRNEIERERLITAIEQAGESIVITDSEGYIQYTNPGFEAVTGYTQEEAEGRTPAFLNSGRHDRSFYRNIWETILSGKRWTGRVTNKKADGTLYTSECAISPVTDRDGRITNFVWIARDITRELEYEKHIARTQKMESIGNLAGGIAHDFNNILYPIVGLSELMMEDFEPDSPEYGNLNEILKAGKRGRDLVRQILAVGRKSEPKRIPVQVSTVLKEVLKLIRSTVPADIEIHSRIPDTPIKVSADPTQLHQVAMNLLTNAYHAVADTSGEITVTLIEKDFGKENLPETLAIPPGRYACLSISDTGHGIEPALMNRIFDPYFTTKQQNKGTGLGLSVVYGIIREYGGDIRVTSEKGKGAAFDVYLPALGRTREENGSVEEIVTAARGDENILLVDDEQAIVNLEKQLLEKLGYKVSACFKSTEALELFNSAPDTFDLIITDMTMPDMTGDRLAKEARSIRPDLPVIICTGFSEKMDEQKAGDLGINGFLMKPVVLKEMARTVRDVLDTAK